METNISKRHQEIGDAISKAKKKLFNASKSGGDLKDAAHTFMSELFELFGPMFAKTDEAKETEEPAINDPKGEEPSYEDQWSEHWRQKRNRPELSDQQIRELCRTLLGDLAQENCEALLLLSDAIENDPLGDNVALTVQQIAMQYLDPARDAYIAELRNRLIREQEGASA